MPTPVPTHRYTKLSTSRPAPSDSSPSAARFTSFSNVTVGAQLVADRPDQALAAEAGKVAAPAPRAPRVGSSTPAAPDRRVGDLAPADARARRPGSCAIVADLLDQRRGAARARPLVAAGDDRAGDVGDRRPHPVAADVDADDPAGRRVQLVEDRARPLAAGSPADLVDEPARRSARPARATRSAWTARSRGRSAARDIVPVRADQLEHRALVDGARRSRGCPGARTCRGDRSASPPSRRAYSKETLLTKRKNTTPGGRKSSGPEGAAR